LILTTSLRELGSCIDVTGTLSVKEHLVPAAEVGLPLSRPGLGPISGPISVLAVMRHVEWARCGGANYRKVAVPVELRSPSREEAQVLVSGIATRVKLFMGRRDWELDWHVYLDIEDDVKAMLSRAGPLDPSGLYSELMGIDRWEDELLGRQWWSSDFDGALSLRWPLPNARSGAETASEHWSLVADDDQGTNITVAQVSDPSTRTNAAIAGARVYLQGPLVNDTPTDTDDHNLLELHPLDSIAYAKDGEGRILTAKPTEAAWPDSIVHWRVAVMTNAGFHRINSCDFVKKERTTTWYLDLPTAAGLPGMFTDVTARSPGLWHSPSNTRYNSRGVKAAVSQPPADGALLDHTAFPADPADGRHKLRVSVTMEVPDDWGGIFLRDYTIRSRPLVAT
jgi:hypothetical protein